MRPVPERARTYLLAHPTQPAPEAARALDVHPRTITVYRVRMRHMGLDVPRINRHLDLDAVREAATEGYTLPEIAERVGVAASSLRSGLWARGIQAYDLRRDHAYTLREAAALFGMNERSAARWLRRWCDAGLIVITQSPGRRRRWRITALAVMAFLEHPDFPLDPTRITDPAWRAYAVAARAGHLKPPAPHEEKPRPTRECVECGRPKSRKGVRCKGCATKKEAAHAPR